MRNFKILNLTLLGILGLSTDVLGSGRYISGNYDTERAYAGFRQYNEEANAELDRKVRSAMYYVSSQYEWPRLSDDPKLTQWDSLGLSSDNYGPSPTPNEGFRKYFEARRDAQVIPTPTEERPHAIAFDDTTLDFLNRIREFFKGQRRVYGGVKKINLIVDLELAGKFDALARNMNQLHVDARNNYNVMLALSRVSSEKLTPTFYGFYNEVASKMAQQDWEWETLGSLITILSKFDPKGLNQNVDLVKRVIRGVSSFNIAVGHLQQLSTVPEIVSDRNALWQVASLVPEDQTSAARYGYDNLVREKAIASALERFKTAKRTGDAATKIGSAYKGYATRKSLYSPAPRPAGYVDSSDAVSDVDSAPSLPVRATLAPRAGSKDWGGRNASRTPVRTRYGEVGSTPSVAPTRASIAGWAPYGAPTTAVMPRGGDDYAGDDGAGAGYPTTSLRSLPRQEANLGRRGVAPRADADWVTETGASGEGAFAPKDGYNVEGVSVAKTAAVFGGSRKAPTAAPTAPPPFPSDAYYDGEGDSDD